ncbi:class I SAM-dependent methyltransferase [Pseudolysobacter antarcticus]|uniref:Class I SAM-dependent methyltransferase n=1 Tax=Pseudolysobacter antarcticus TaxID=2511995 RepID=A0A411HJJ6_9GAMM|nr:class I SAM-dependent methyltransferase [Pseudolysobacter antarcticus]QBB70584.1 class I SAM-dependent methyltransferase [Pseudolysobacter antarcticus]
MTISAPPVLRIETLVSCPVCGGGSLHHLLTSSDFESATGDYGIDECADCGIAFTNPRPIEADLPKLYEQRDSADFPSAASDGFITRLRDFSIDRYLRTQLSDKRLDGFAELQVLDYGCGDGALSRGVDRYAKAHGLAAKITAVDFHALTPAALNNMPLLRYLTHTQLQADDQTYDVIFLRHVLEHHPHPLRLLQRLAELLRPDGRLCIEVPNRRSIWASAFGKFFFGYYLPRHLVHFDRSSIENTFARAGFHDIRIESGHTPLIGGSLGSLIGRKISNTGLFGMAGYPLQVAVDLVVGRSTTLRVIATRA